MTNLNPRITEILRSFEERAAAIGEAQETLQTLNGSAYSRDGAVTVTVAPSGAVVDVQLSPRAMERSHIQLQLELMELIRLATEHAAEQMEEQLGEAFGPDLDKFRAAMAGETLPPPIGRDNIFKNDDGGWR